MVATDTELLLKACRANPDEDTPRLILADSIEDDFGGAAAYIRQDVDLARHGARKIPLSRRTTARDYVRWVGTVLGADESVIGIGSAGWDHLMWTTSDRRNCLFVVARGLPMRLSTTAPMLMERAALQFLFPLTSVFVTCRRPWRDDLDGVFYGWTGSTYPQMWNTWEETPHEIPHTLWDRLAAPGHYSRHWNRGHYTRLKDSIDDLSNAALAFGRTAVA